MCVNNVLMIFQDVYVISLPPHLIIIPSGMAYFPTPGFIHSLIISPVLFGEDHR